MITSLAQYITGVLLKNNTVEHEHLDIYIYGFEVLISGTLSLFTGLILGIMFSQLAECIVFLVVFVILRKYCGGYHANTYLKCNSIFAVNIATVMTILKFDIIYPFVFHMVLCALCIFIYCLSAPIENICKPITDEDKKKCRLIAVVLALITVALSSAAYFYSLKYSIVMDMAILSVAVSMIIEKIRKGESHDEKR